MAVPLPWRADSHPVLAAAAAQTGPSLWLIVALVLGALIAVGVLIASIRRNRTIRRFSHTTNTPWRPWPSPRLTPRKPAGVHQLDNYTVESHDDYWTKP